MTSERVENREPRPIPAREIDQCERCGQRIVWVITVAGPNGRGGKAMPLDPDTSESGNVAVRAGFAGRVLARVLCKDERPDTTELLAMPHFATCPAGRP